MLVGSFEGGIVRKTTLPRFLDELEEVGERRRLKHDADEHRDSEIDSRPLDSDGDPMYIFGNIDGSKETGLIVGEPTVTLGQKFSSACRPGVTQLYVGGPGSGSPVHWHNDAVNYAVRPIAACTRVFLLRKRHRGKQIPPSSYS